MIPDLLEGIDLIVFDKDGTLIDFHRMWGGWVRSLAEDLRGSTGLALSGRLERLLGVDPATGLVKPHGLLAATPMSRIRAAVIESVASAGFGPADAEAAVDAAWHAPDPVALARPLADLPRLFAALRQRVGHLAVATSDDREPTERTLVVLGIAELVSGVACADDGRPVKPAPDAIFELCARIGVPPRRTAVVGDAPADIAMGRAAGVRRVIGVLTGVGDATILERDADAVLGSVAELMPA